MIKTGDYCINMMWLLGRLLVGENTEEDLVSNLVMILSWPLGDATQLQTRHHHCHPVQWHFLEQLQWLMFKQLDDRGLDYARHNIKATCSCHNHQADFMERFNQRPSCCSEFIRSRLATLSQRLDQECLGICLNMKLTFYGDNNIPYSC